MKSIIHLIIILLIVGSITCCKGSDSGDPSNDQIIYKSPKQFMIGSKDYLRFAASRSAGSLGEIITAIVDLAVFNGKLYIGIGDANNNLGSAFCPLTGEACPSEDAQGHGIPVLTLSPNETQTKIEFVVQDEEISLFRPLADKMLIPGVDATEDAMIGNVYILQNGTWTKHRSLLSNLHTHDIAEFKGSIFAVGSGIETLDQYSSMQVAGTIWRSDDNGQTWKVEYRHTNKPAGDCRYTMLIPLKNKLYAFGNYLSDTNNDGKVDAINNISQVYDGSTWTFVDLLPNDYYFGTYSFPFSPEKAFVIGYNIVNKVAIKGYVVTESSNSEITFFNDNDFAPIDAFQVSQGDLLILGKKGQSSTDTTSYFSYTIYRTKDLVNFTEVVKWTSMIDYRSIALWNNDIYLGASDGYIYKCER